MKKISVLGFLAVLLIFLNLAVGSTLDNETIMGIHIGDSVKTVVKILGNPESKSKATEMQAADKIPAIVYRYPSMGITIVFWGSKPPIVHRLIVSSPKQGKASNNKNLSIQTSKGIRIGSKREEVIRAYGKPAYSDNKSLTFSEDAPTLRFIIIRGQVAKIILEGYQV